MAKYQATIDAKGRVVIPIELRQKLDLHPGKVVLIKDKKKKLVVKKHQETPTPKEDDDQ